MPTVVMVNSARITRITRPAFRYSRNHCGLRACDHKRETNLHAFQIRPRRVVSQPPVSGTTTSPFSEKTLAALDYGGCSFRQTPL
ncbi:MAG: hypothetical protein KKB50_08235 [Planctomycetes bacterium]|nr:hypothetical protein [Planctomycetota bacterium]